MLGYGIQYHNNLREHHDHDDALWSISYQPIIKRPSSTVGAEPGPSLENSQGSTISTTIASDCTKRGILTTVQSRLWVLNKTLLK